jgi:hypothetical protein
MNISTKNLVAAAIGLAAIAVEFPVLADTGRPSEATAQVVAADTCAVDTQKDAGGSYYTYLRVVDGMSRENALKAARHIDNPAPRERAGNTANASASATTTTPAVLR